MSKRDKHRHYACLFGEMLRLPNLKRLNIMLPDMLHPSVTYHLKELLCKTTTLEDLRLTLLIYNIRPLCDASKQHIKEGFSQNRSLKRIESNSPYFLEVTGVPEYKNEALHPLRVLVLFEEAFMPPECAQELLFSNLYEFEMRAFVDAMRHNQCIRKLSLVECGIEGERDALLIARLLSSKPSLISLSLARNEGFGNEGLKVLCDGIHRNTTLQSLNLTMTGCSGQSAALILRNMLRRNKVLTELIFDDNEISGSGADCPLAQGLAQNKTLKVLGLSNCSLDVSAIGRLLDVIVAPRSAVQTISLGNVALPLWTPPATHLVAPPKSICLRLGISEETIRSVVPLIKSNQAFLTAVRSAERC